MTERERAQIINELLNALSANNRVLVNNGTVTQNELSNFIHEERARYQEMSDLELRNILVINL